MLQIPNQPQAHMTTTTCALVAMKISTIVAQSMLEQGGVIANPFVVLSVSTYIGSITGKCVAVFIRVVFKRYTLIDAMHDVPNRPLIQAAACTAALLAIAAKAAETRSSNHNHLNVISSS